MLHQETLHSSDFTSHLNSTEMKSLLHSANRVVFRRKEQIFRIGERAESALLINRGCVKLFQITPDGREVIFRFSMAGEIIGLAELLADTPREVSAEAQMETEAHIVPRRALLRFFWDNPGVAVQAIGVLSARVRALEQALVNIATEDVETRVLRLLGQLAACGRPDPSGSLRLDFPFTHQDIANQIGASRQTVSGVFADLKRRGVIDAAERSVVLLRQDRLKQELNEIANGEL